MTKHLDANGQELQVGDDVIFHGVRGTVLILETWPQGDEAGLYVTNIGTWGDCRAVPAARVVKAQA